MDALRSVTRAAWEGAKRARRVEVLGPMLAAIVFPVMLALVVRSPGLVLGQLLVPGVYLLGSALQGASRAGSRGFVTTFVAGLGVLAVSMTPFIGLLSVHAHRSIAEGWAPGVLGAPLFGAVCGPFLTAGSHLLRRNEGLRDALGRALAGASVGNGWRGPVRGMFVGASVLPLPLLQSVVHTVARHDLSVLLTAALIVLAMSVVPVWIVGFMAACAEEDDLRLVGDAPRAAPRDLLLAPSIAVVFAGAMALRSSSAVSRSSAPLWLAGLGLLVWAVAAFEVARTSPMMKRRETAARLHRIRGRVRLAGDTVFDTGATISATGEVHGAARFASDDGTYVLSLPSRVRLSGVTERITTDVAVVLVASGPVESLGLRDGVASWPSSAVLVLETSDDRRGVTAMDERARAVGLWAMAATVLLVAAGALLSYGSS